MIIIIAITIITQSMTISGNNSNDNIDQKFMIDNTNKLNDSNKNYYTKLLPAVAAEDEE